MSSCACKSTCQLATKVIYISHAPRHRPIPQCPSHEPRLDDFLQENYFAVILSGWAFPWAETVTWVNGQPVCCLTFNLLWWRGLGGWRREKKKAEDSSLINSPREEHGKEEEILCILLLFCFVLFRLSVYITVGFCHKWVVHCFSMGSGFSKSTCGSTNDMVCSHRGREREKGLWRYLGGYGQWKYSYLSEQ